MLEDEQKCSYNGGGDVNPLKTWLDFSYIQYIKNACSCHFLQHNLQFSPPLLEMNG